jgi:hypothetical protein
VQRERLLALLREQTGTDWVPVKKMRALGISAQGLWFLLNRLEQERVVDVDRPAAVITGARIRQ